MLRSLVGSEMCIRDSGKLIHCPWCQESFPDRLNHPIPKRPAKAKPSALLEGTAGDKMKEGGGHLQPHAAKVLMKLLYGARLARFDLLRAINNLAASITKWTPECDKRLHHIMCYVNSTVKHRLVGFVGDKPCDTQPHLFADADFAGDPETQRSMSRLHLALRGPATCYPLTGAPKRQTCVSHSTPEAGIVAADFALRTSGIPAQQLWNVILGRQAGLVFNEDNHAMIRVCQTGRNPTMRHLGPTHRVSVAWLHERFA